MPNNNLRNFKGETKNVLSARKQFKNVAARKKNTLRLTFVRRPWTFRRLNLEKGQLGLVTR